MEEAERRDKEGWQGRLEGQEAEHKERSVMQEKSMMGRGGPTRISLLLADLLLDTPGLYLVTPNPAGPVCPP